jgi:hypothetical protein
VQGDGAPGSSSVWLQPQVVVAVPSGSFMTLYRNFCIGGAVDALELMHNMAPVPM